MKGVLINQFQPFRMYLCQAAQLMWYMSLLRAMVPLGPSECSLAVALYKYTDNIAQLISTYQLIQSDGVFLTTWTQFNRAVKQGGWPGGPTISS